MVTEAGDLLMCGDGRHGRLGLGDEEDRATPTLVARAVFDGEAVLMVACGEEHTAVLTERRRLYLWERGPRAAGARGLAEPAGAEAGAGGGVQRRADRDGGRGR